MNLYKKTVKNLLGFDGGNCFLVAAKFCFSLGLLLCSLSVNAVITFNIPTTSTTGTYVISWSGSWDAPFSNGLVNIEEKVGSSWVSVVQTGQTSGSFTVTNRASGTYTYKTYECPGFSTCKAPVEKTIIVIGSSGSSSSAAVIPPVGNTPLPAPSTSTKISKVGIVKGGFNVDESGSANYTIPIAVPAGVAGVAPQISINYTSQGGVGLVGYGANISGLGAVTRCQQTLLHDGAAKPLTWGEEDRFCLNGQRLMLVSSTNREYKTEIDSFTKIQAYGGTTGNPDYFVVEGKDNSKTTYGGTADSKVNAINATLNWAISKFEDGVKNRIEYKYEGSLSNSHRIAAINYAFPSSSIYASAAATVVFEYADNDRSDVASAYLSDGSTYKNSKLLKSVTSKNSGFTFRKYNFYFNEVMYSTVDNLSRLTSVEECTSDTIDSCYPRTRFYWGYEDVGFSSLSEKITTLPIGENFKGYKFIDYNGDGRQDIVWIRGEGSNRHVEYASFDKNSSGGMVKKDFIGAPWLSYRVFKPDIPSLLQDPEDVEPILDVIDYNADGRQDLVVCKPVEQGVSKSCDQRELYLSIPDSKGGWGLSASPILLPFKARDTRFADLDADGLLDAIEVNSTNLSVYKLKKKSGALISSNQYYAFSSTPISMPLVDVPVVPSLDTTSNPYEPPQIIVFGYKKSQLADFNGDGKLDFALPVHTYREQSLHNNIADQNKQKLELFVFLNNGDNFVYSPNFSVYLEGTPINNWLEPNLLNNLEYSLVDFNMDGFSDLAYNSIFNWCQYVNNAQKLNNLGYITDIGLDRGNRSSSVGFFDYNTDGSLDFVWHDKSSSSIKWRAWNSSTMKFSDADGVISSGVSKSSTYSFGDINGDGFADMMRIKPGSATSNVDMAFYYGKKSPLDKIRLIEDGNGHPTQIFYGSLADSNNYTTLESVNTQQLTNPNYCDNWDFYGEGGNIPCVVPVVNTLNMENFYSALNQPFGAVFEENNAAPVLEMSGPLYVVTKVQANSLSNVHYHYHHARIQAGGRGYLGFEKLTTIDYLTGVRTETTYHQDWPLTGSPKSTVVKTKEGMTLSTATNTWIRENDSRNSKVTRVFLDTTSEVSYALKDNGATQGTSLQTTTTDNDYDAYGNVTKITAVVSGSANTSTKITTNTYYPTEWELRKGRIDTTTSSVRVNSASPIVRSTKFVYYPESDLSWPGMLHEEIIEPGPNQKVTTHTYDDVGNKIITEITANVGPGVSQTRKTTIEYDPSKRFAATTKDSLSNIVSGVVKRHDIHGLPTEVRDTNGVITYIEYLDDGREQQRRDSVGAWTHTERGLCTDGVVTCPTSARYWVRNLVSGGGKTVEFADMLGRVVRSTKVLFDGRESYVDTEYDNLGRVNRKSEPYVWGENIYWSAFEYDILGRVTKITMPDGSISTNTYDGYKTITTNALKQSRTEEKNSLGHLVKVTDNLTGTISYGYDALGNLTSATTVASGKTVNVQMCYDYLGRKIAMHDPDKGGFLGNATATCATVSTYLNKPTAEKLSGWWFYQYNDFGELIVQTDTKKQVTKMGYDELGRMKTRTDYLASGAVDAHTRWYFDKYLGESTARTETQRKPTGVVTSYGVISENCSGSNYCQTYLYDAASRITDTTTYLPGSSVGYINSVRFDTIGRVKDTYDVLQGIVTAYGSSGTRTLYNDYGYAGEIRDLATGDVLQKTIEMNARGQTKTEWRNNGGAGIVNYTYDDKTGLLKKQSASVAGGLFPIQDVTYEWDTVGNLESRWNQSSNVGRTAKKNLQESFCYDGLNRLIKSHQGTLTGSCSLTASEQDIEYDGLGNITRKTGVGTYTYSGKGPHAVTSTTNDGAYAYDNNGNQIGGAGRAITYSSYDQPTRITKGTTATEFKYAPDRSRWERIDTKAGVKTITHYLGNVERIEVESSGIVEWKRYIAGAVYTVRTTATSSGSGVNYSIQRTDKSFIYNDHLGSLDVVVNNVGQVTHTASFDAWGNRRSGENWTAAFAASSLSLTNYTQPITQRGYTGHEMLDDTGLIHMNGRIYDPRLARFMQADPFIQAATNTQSYSRYSYTINNPLNATDPSGFTFDLVNKYILRPIYKSLGYDKAQVFISIASLSCGYAYAVCYSYGTYNNARANGVPQGGAMYMAALSFITSKASSAIAGQNNANPLGSFVASGVIGGFAAEMQGGEFGHGFFSAGAGAAAGAKYDGWQGFIAATIIGGTASEMTGGKFANGAASAAFSYAAQWGISKMGAGANLMGSSVGNTDTANEGTAEQRLQTYNEAKQKVAPSEEDMKFIDAYALVVVDVNTGKVIPPASGHDYYYVYSNEEYLAFKNNLRAGQRVGFVNGYEHKVGGFLGFFQRSEIVIYRSAVISANDISIGGFQGVHNLSALENAMITMGHEVGHRLGLEQNFSGEHVLSNARGVALCKSAGACNGI